MASVVRKSTVGVVFGALLGAGLASSVAAHGVLRVSLAIPAKVDLGTAVDTSGRVADAPHGTRAVLQQLDGRHWARLSTTTVRRGLFKMRFLPRRPGRYHVRVALYAHGRRVFTSAVRILVIAARKPRAPASPARPSWLTLPGTVTAFNELVLLTETTYVHGPGGGGPIYDLVGTQGGAVISIDDRSGVPSGTEIEGGSSMLTPPLPGHPHGIVVLTMRVSTPASGIEPEHSSGYYSLFDAATGAHISTSAPFEIGLLDAAPVAVVGESLRLIDCNAYFTVSPTGTVSESPLPGPASPEQDNCARRGASAVVNEEMLIYSYSETCPTVYVSNVVTEAVVSRSPCLRTNIEHSTPTLPAAAATSGSRDWFFNGAVYGVEDEPRLFSAATGAPLEAGGTFALEDGEALGGVRSSVALINWGDGDSYFVSTSTGLPVFTADGEEHFSASGIADNDAWVEGSAGRVVISGVTGGLLASTWKVYPVAGGTGWTLATEANGACCNSEFLLRSREPMLAAHGDEP